MDALMTALWQQLGREIDRGLWVVDENLANGSQPRPRAGWQALTNRVDLECALQQAGWSVSLSDFDFSTLATGSLQRIVYRVSKEKPVVHHVINQALRCLQPGGELWLYGYKNEGTKTYYGKARELFGEGELEKLGKGGFAACLVRDGEVAGEPLDDRDYPHLRVVAEQDGLTFYSKPGVFGWDKIDLGSQFLIQELEARLSSEPGRVLDLGCGYGYLSLHAARLGARSVVATDNNAAALTACAYNLEQYTTLIRSALESRVVADNCAESLSGAFDLILCNPPFHQGFAVEGELTERFLGAARRLLAPGGQALFVVNRFIPLERKAAGLFKRVETFADNGSFKLVKLA